MSDPAPRLVGIPEAPVPHGGEAEVFRGADGVALRAALFPATARAAGSVVLSPGRTEPRSDSRKTLAAIDVAEARACKRGMP